MREANRYEMLIIYKLFLLNIGKALRAFCIQHVAHPFLVELIVKIEIKIAFLNKKMRE